MAPPFGKASLASASLVTVCLGVLAAALAVRVELVCDDVEAVVDALWEPVLAVSETAEEEDAEDVLDVLEVLLGVVLDTVVVVVVVRAADWVEVEPPQPASAPTTARTARPEIVRLNGIDRAAYPSPSAVTSGVSVSGPLPAGGA
jgi:hypothetical protein